ncbi:MAG TPA: CPBP family intramembrane glutamic endopeptidase [Candidatus Acidoferrum sp.]|nr:CPBP family intramembrane glutamic endopeptidase [Candidatus Acidoferrum sp.]
MQHLLFLFLLVVPISDLYAIPKLKRNPSSENKIRYYQLICAWMWIASALAVVVIGFRPLFTISPSPGEISWLLPHPWVRHLVEALIAIAAIIVVLPVGLVAWKKLTKRPLKYSAAAAFKSFSYFLPATWTERHWWVFVSITAGVCEETLFRGFMPHYLHVFPCTLNLTLALLISSAIFGVHHLYQGPGGVAGTAIVGILFGLLFLLTGNLLLPIVFHVAMDLRLLALLRPPAAAPS